MPAAYAATLADLSIERFRKNVTELRLQRVLNMIETQPERSVRELADEVRLSPAHLERLFKKEIGLRIGNLVAEHRLQRAANLLAASDRPIKQIAHLVGYMHQSSFVRAFQRRFARAPRVFRQESVAANG